MAIEAGVFLRSAYLLADRATEKLLLSDASVRTGNDKIGKVITNLTVWLHIYYKWF